jgi:hypothetical protein
MNEAESWYCKECGSVLGWQSEGGLSVNTDSVERFTLPALSEEIWVTCKRCMTVQIWRAKVELPYDEEEGPPLEHGEE